MHFTKELKSNPLLIFLLALLSIVVETFSEESVSKIDPMDHLRGRRLSESARQLVSMCNGMAEMGLSYEAARLLKSTSVYSTNEETSKEAKRIMISWRINEMEINDANADSIRKTIRITLNRNRSALLDYKRAQTLLKAGQTKQAAKIIAKAKQVELHGESKEAQRRILSELNLRQELLDNANNQKSLESLMSRSMEVSKFNEISEFLRTVHPESGNVMRSLISKIFPESAQIDNRRNSE